MMNLISDGQNDGINHSLNTMQVHDALLEIDRLIYIQDYHVREGMRGKTDEEARARNIGNAYRSTDASTSSILRRDGLHSTELGICEPLEHHESINVIPLSDRDFEIIQKKFLEIHQVLSEKCLPCG
jgi:hypothetical protein